jgi:hypothetical protein
VKGGGGGGRIIEDQDLCVLIDGELGHSKSMIFITNVMLYFQVE